MVDQAAYDPRDYPVEQLEAAARGDSTIMAAALAVALLDAHPDVDTRATMLRLAQDQAADPRGRRSAVRALAGFPDTAPTLRTLTGSDTPLAAAARQALNEMGQAG
ncbi:hypothetical protein ND748_19690 [Frankia sp. AiPs1]|uniref:hypothetical protein n=1 Tax=Frankia sp. AiPs1 TaxID=573493 RepID=UPI0020433121|nr:hypothetical protein [Frankia sp. AiPs1]MCM3923882.1 hypothetical protein [Frankia sp. AiPs1]